MTFIEVGQELVFSTPLLVLGIHTPGLEVVLSGMGARCRIDDVEKDSRKSELQPLLNPPPSNFTMEIS